MNKKDLKAVLLASALGGAAFVAPVMAEENSQDPVDVNDQTIQTVTADESTVNEQITNTESAENSSVKDGWSDGYYYENGQKVVSQFKTIDGKTYYFQGDGSPCRDGIYWVNSDQYYFDADGVMQTNFEYFRQYFGADGKAVTNQWIQFGSKWRFYGNEGTYYIGYFHAINENYYAFSDDGYALNGWQDIYGSWYYFSEKGMRLENQWVDGGQYYVDQYGVMLTNTWIDNETYVDENGKKTVNSWELVDGKWKYKLADGTYVTSRMVLNNGKYYAVDYAGNMVTNGLCQIYNYNATGNVIGTVRADSDGVLLKGWYTDEYDNTYYFGDDYLAYVTNLYDIDGTTYYFRENYLCRNTTFVFDGKLYSSDANGVATIQDTSNQTKWIQIGRNWYYIKNGTALSDVIEEIDGSYYYFNEEGIMYSSTTFDYQGKKYYANSNGVIDMNKRNTWAKTENGQTIYYLDDGSIAHGQHYTIDNKLYSFEYDGYLKTGVVFVYSLDGGNTYLTDESGAIDRISGWKQYRYHWYYAGEGGALYCNKTLVENGKEYYFSYGGDMAINSIRYENGHLYYYDTNGVMVDYVDSFTGIKQFHGKTYLNKNGDYYYSGEYNGYYFESGVMAQDTIVNETYYVDINGKVMKGWIYNGYTYYYADPTTGALVKNQWLTIDGKQYYFNNYDMSKGCAWTPDGYCHFDENGVLINKVKPASWYQDPDTNKWYYINENGEFNTKASLVIDGVKYYFNGYTKGAQFADFGLAQNCPWYDLDTQTMYWINADGNGIDTTDGWKKSDSGMFGYVENGKLVTGLKKIGNKTYYFGPLGCFNAGIQNFNGKAYVIDENGDLVDYKEGWNTFGDELFYIKNGEALMDTIVDNRYIDAYGLTLTGPYYQTGSSASILLIHGELAKKQWVKCYREKYYGDENGHILKNQWVGNSYVNNYGCMVKDTWIGNYYVDANGEWKPNGSTSQETKAEWKQTNGKWLYQHKDGTHTQNDFETIAGQRYYFDTNGYMVTGWQKINGEDYYFNASGIMAMNTWVGDYYLDADGTMLTNAFTPDGFYCGKDGAYLTNQKVTVSGKDYYLNAAGTLAKNQWAGDYYVDSNNNPFKEKWAGSYYLGPDGKYVKNQFTPDGYYCGADGVYVTNRWIVVDGKDYYMNAYGKMTKEAWQGAYYLGSDGAMLTNAFTPDGYYCGANGAYLTSQWFKHGGKDYYVNGSGLVVKNAWVGSYYLGSDGVMATSSWVDNNQYYVNENGVYVPGRWVQYGSRWCYYAGNVYAKDITLNIGGKAYTFDSEGYMVE